MSAPGRVMPDDFQPTRRGRRPLVNIEPMVEQAVENEGRWVAFDLPVKEARSAQRQLSMQEHIEVSAEHKAESSSIRLYVRCEEKYLPH